MDIKDIIVPADFLNLTKDDIDRIATEMDLEITEDDPKRYLYEIKDILFTSEKTKLIIKNKIFAGKTSVKWYKINFNGKNDINEIALRLESKESYYNSFNNPNTSELDNPKIYSCIKVDENIYIMRVLIPSGTKTINDGFRLKRVASVRNVVLIINLRSKYIEVRANSIDAKKIIDCICRPLINENITEVDVLGKYGGNIEDFRNSLDNGRFFDVTSIPDLNIVITGEQNELLVSVLEALDEYFINKDIEKLKSELLNIDLGTEEIPFTQLFLAGLSQIGLAIRKDIEEDLSNQSLYGVLKSYMTNQKGFLKFTLINEEETECDYTIQVGMNTNSISFRSSSTEQAIKYIRKKILEY